MSGTDVPVSHNGFFSNLPRNRNWHTLSNQENIKDPWFNAPTSNQIIM